MSQNEKYQCQIIGQIYIYQALLLTALLHLTWTGPSGLNMFTPTLHDIINRIDYLTSSPIYVNNWARHCLNVVGILYFEIHVAFYCFFFTLQPYGEKHLKSICIFWVERNFSVAKQCIVSSGAPCLIKGSTSVTVREL